MEDESDSKPSSGFTSGALIQILNPKAWIAAMTVFSQFTDVSGNHLMQVVTIIVAFLFVVTIDFGVGYASLLCKNLRLW